ncbi:MAG: hypothetical protein ABI884_00290 [Gemmatimonadota bacterium]
MTETNGTRDVSVAGYDDRLPVRGRALLPAIALGVGAGLAVFYVARIMAERAPLVPEPALATMPPARTRG